MATGVLAHDTHGPGGQPHVEPLPPAIGGNQTMGSVVDTIGDIATCVKPHPRQWYVAFAVGFTLLGMFGIAVTYLLTMGTGIWGINSPDGLGLRDHQLRLVDRHRPRRHADLRDPACCCTSAGGRRSTGSPRR